MGPRKIILKYKTNLHSLCSTLNSPSDSYFYKDLSFNYLSCHGDSQQLSIIYTQLKDRKCAEVSCISRNWNSIDFRR